MKTINNIITTIIITLFTVNANAQFTTEAANTVKLNITTGNELNYTAAAYGASVKWETAAEANTSHFELEISYDGIEFKSVRKVAASETTNWNTVYEVKFNKSYTSVEKVYYRLKTVFVDGTATVTNATAFQMLNSANFASIH
jgi:hypothetical protein